MMIKNSINLNSQLQITKQEYDYLVYLLLVKIIAFLSINYKYVDEFEIANIVEELNILLGNKDLFDESNIITIGKEIIETNFDNILKQMKEKIVNPEISLSRDKFDQIKKALENDKANRNFINRGDMLSDYSNGKYYRFFRNIQGLTERYDSSRTDICAGETIYHSFARFYAEGIDEYFNYFKKMSDNDLINYQNQKQEHGFCNCIPCYYWFLDSKNDLSYFNELIKTKDIKLNHISGNEHGPSTLSLIIDMLQNNSYWDRRKNQRIKLDNDFRDSLFETIFNIIVSNYSISYDSKELLELFIVFHNEYYVKEAIQYIISESGIKKQLENNKYPIIRGGEVDLVYDEARLNKELYSMINSIKKLEKNYDIK